MAKLEGSDAGANFLRQFVAEIPWGHHLMILALTGEGQKAVKTTNFDLQMNPANPGMSFHKLDNAKDRNFWSVRVSGDIRVIAL